MGLHRLEANAVLEDSCVCSSGITVSVMNESNSLVQFTHITLGAENTVIRSHESEVLPGSP